MLQDSIFVKGEGDNWYQRNKSALAASGKIDWPSRLIRELADRDRLRSVVELGCSNGYRLAKLRSLLSAECSFAGIDAGQEAVSEGMASYPGLDLRHAPLSEVPFQEPFDLVIVNFVLHWIDRQTLARSLSEVDRLVRDGGYLVLGDFLPDFAQRRRYHHLADDWVFTFKQDYGQAFLALGTYRELTRVTFNHDLAEDYAIGPCSTGQRGFTALLHKSLHGYYPEV